MLSTESWILKLAVNQLILVPSIAILNEKNIVGGQPWVSVTMSAHRESEQIVDLLKENEETPPKKKQKVRKYFKMKV